MMWGRPKQNVTTARGQNYIPDPLFCPLHHTAWQLDDEIEHPSEHRYDPKMVQVLIVAHSCIGTAHGKTGPHS